MMNEAHDGLRRCIRTRRVGQRVLPAAHQAGVRYLAMEALTPAFAHAANATRTAPAVRDGYLAQPEMRDLIATALDLGWTLVSYEANFDLKTPEWGPLSREETNWREDQQARNLLGAVAALGEGQQLLVWCGNGHLTKRRVGDWEPMAVRFRELSGIEPFAIDQIQGVEFGDSRPFAGRWAEAYTVEIEGRDGAAGFLSAEAPEGWRSTATADAFVLAGDNVLS
jgi:hypothetical protein